MMDSEEKVFVIFCTFIYCTCMYNVHGESIQQLSTTNISSDICSSICNCDESIYKSVCNRSNLTRIPETLSSRVKELYINENEITTLQSLKLYTSVEIVSISSNKLTTLSSDEINNLTHLQILYVDHNEIVYISSPFYGLNSLIVLNVASNMLSSIRSFSFLGLSSLQQLDLSNNAIVSLGDDAFTGLNSLKVLSLRNNKLTTLPSSEQLTVISSTLIKLNIGLNHLKHVTLNQLNCLQRLQELHLDRCSIESLQVNNYETKDSTKLIHSFDDSLNHMTFNSLRHHHYHEKQVNENTFNVPLKSLKLLNLSFNNITMLSGENEKLFHHIHCVNLEGNFIKCDCSLKWLKDFTVERKMFTRTSAASASAGISASSQLNMIDPFNGTHGSSQSTDKVAQSAAAAAAAEGITFNCPINHVTSSVKCLNVPNNPLFDQVNVSCTHTSFQLYVNIASLEKSPVFIWFLLLCASSVATLIMIYVKYSIYKPTFPPFYTINRCQRDTHDDTIPFLGNQWSTCTSSSSCTSLVSSSSSSVCSSSLSSSSGKNNQLSGVTIHPLIAQDDLCAHEMSSNKRSPGTSYIEGQITQQQQQRQVHHLVPARVTEHVSPYQCTSDSTTATNDVDLSDKTQMLVISSKSTTKTTLLSHTRATDEMV